jgi:exonuclease V gamma subunit
MIVLSNFLETLTALLIENLYDHATTPFTRRLVIVPDLSIKDLLLQTIARERQIASGVKFLSLAQFFGFPSPLELSFFLETEMIQTPSPSTQQYAAGSERRLCQLADRLASFFLEAALYGGIEKQSWQQTLWKKAAAKYPALEIRIDSHRLAGQQVHLFGFSDVPEGLLRFFEQIKATCYFFSPCGGFWADYASSKEQLFALRAQKGAPTVQKEAYEESFAEQNPLLAYCGKVGRQMQALLLEKPCEERYTCPEGNEALAKLQRSIFFGEKGEKMAQDASLQLLSAPTRWHEVELLRKKICTALASGCLPQQIQVFAPDISLYAPFIQTLFADGKIAICIEDLPSWQSDPLLQAVRHLFSQDGQEMSSDFLLKLFSFAPFMERFDLKPDDLLLMEQWCLQEVKQLLCSLPPSQLQLFDTFYRIKQELQEDLSKDPQPLKAWAGHFAQMVDKYFVGAKEAILEPLKSIQTAFAGNGVPISYASARRLMRQLTDCRRGSLHPGHLSVVSFSSLPQGVVWPSDMIYVLGMDEEAFPRLGVPSFSRLNMPQKTDSDRYLFLQLLLSARKRICISYSRHLPGETEELHPSFALAELGLEVERYEGAVKRRGGEQSREDFCVNREMPLEIELRKLSKLIKDPEQFFLSESLGIYEREKETEEAREFILSPLAKYKLCKKALKMPIAAAVAEAERAREFPRGMFKEVALHKVTEETDEERASLAKWGICPEELFSITLSATCKEPQVLENGDRLFPPYVIDLGDGERVQLLGTLEEVSLQGLLVRGQGTLLDQMRRAPQFLVFRLVFPDAGSELFLLKKGKARPIAVPDPLQALKRLLLKYREALQGVVVFPPEEVEKLLHGF